MKQNIHLIILCVVLILTAGCTKPDRSEEVTALSIEQEDLAISDINKALERVDSAEKAGVFTAVRANNVKACIYVNKIIIYSQRKTAPLRRAGSAPV